MLGILAFIGFSTLLVYSLFVPTLTIRSAAALVGEAPNDEQEGVIRLGDVPTEIAIDAKRNLLYVTHPNSNTISVINASTNAVIQTVDSGGANPLGIAVNAENNKLYVANFESDSVSVIDAKTGKMLANVTNVNYHPYRIAINPITNLVYVASIGGIRTLNVIDGFTDKIIYNITLARGDSNGLAINPNTSIAYVTHDFSNFVSVVDISPARVSYEGRLVETLQVGDRVFDVAVNPITNTYYVMGFGVYAIDGSSNRATANITTDVYTGGGIAVNTQTNKIYVPNGYSNSTTVIDGITNTITNVIDVNSEAFILAINPQTNLIYVASQPNAIKVIDGNTNAIVPEFGSLALFTVAVLMVGVIFATNRFGTRK